MSNSRILNFEPFRTQSSISSKIEPTKIYSLSFEPMNWVWSNTNRNWFEQIHYSICEQNIKHFHITTNLSKLDSATGKNNLDNHTIFRSLLTLINQIKIMCKKHENANRKKPTTKDLHILNFHKYLIETFHWLFSQFIQTAYENVKDIKN